MRTWPEAGSENTNSSGAPPNPPGFNVGHRLQESVPRSDFPVPLHLPSHGFNFGGRKGAAISYFRVWTIEPLRYATWLSILTTPYEAAAYYTVLRYNTLHHAVLVMLCRTGKHTTRRTRRPWARSPLTIPSNALWDDLARARCHAKPASNATEQNGSPSWRSHAIRREILCTTTSWKQFLRLQRC